MTEDEWLAGVWEAAEEAARRAGLPDGRGFVLSLLAAAREPEAAADLAAFLAAPPEQRRVVRALLRQPSPARRRGQAE